MSTFEQDNAISTVPSNIFVQNVPLNIDSLKSSVSINIVFGIYDNLSLKFSPDKDSSWTIMNQSWTDFNQSTLITEEDLWPSMGRKSGRSGERSLFNAKLYPVLHPHLTVEDMSQLNQNFWMDLIKQTRNVSLVGKWRESLRLSLEEIGSLVDLEKMFENRRRLFNIVNARHLVKSVTEKKPIKFGSLIKNAVHDGYAKEILKLLDEGLL